MRDADASGGAPPASGRHPRGAPDLGRGQQEQVQAQGMYVQRRINWDLSYQSLHLDTSIRLKIPPINRLLCLKCAHAPLNHPPPLLLTAAPPGLPLRSSGPHRGRAPREAVRVRGDGRRHARLGLQATGAHPETGEGS